jgi:hypothetical protein
MQQHPIKQQSQPQQPTGNINPIDMAHMGQLPQPVISTSTVGNTGVHPMSNGPMMDTHIQNRAPAMHQLGYGMPHHPHYGVPPHLMSFPMQTSYAGPSPMPTPQNPAIMTPRLPPELSPVRPLDIQNHNAAKVPISQPTSIIVAKPPGTIPTTVPMPPVVSAPIKRERRRLAIVDPKTKHVYTEDELKGSATSQSSTPAIDTSDPTTTTTTVTTNVTTTATTTTTTTTIATTTVTPAPTTISKEDHPISSNQQSLPESTSPVDSSKTAPTISNISAQKDTSNDHAQNLAPNVPSSTSPTSNSKSPVINNNLATTREQSTTSNAIEKTAPTITDSMQALSISASKTDASATINKPVVPANSTEAKTLQHDVVDDASPRVEEGDINKQELKSVGDKEDNHVSPNQAESSKKLNPALPYSDGQYSPLNPTGHRKYSMNFLKAVGKMLGLMPLDDREPYNDVFAPPYIQNHRDFGIPRRNSQQTLNNKQPVRRIIATQSLQPEFELKTVEKPWKPELEREKVKAIETVEAGGEIDTQRLLKLFRGHLNKITPQKYDSIIAKIEALNLTGDDRLKSVIDLVFDKAVDEPGFCELYARVSKVIASRNSQFNHHLLKKCQEEFETSDLYSGLNVEGREQDIENETDPAKKKLLSEELYEDMRLRRKKYLGTIKLIGEMYKLDLLVPKIIGFCIARLLDEASNENLECLCSLLTTVGPKMVSEKDELIKATVKNTLQVLGDIANSKKTDELFILESRIKFKILDTIDLSRKNWRPRMVENNPKKLSEIHEEIKPRQPNFPPRNSIKNNDPIGPAPRRNHSNQSFTSRR